MIAASSIQGAGSTELSRVLLADDHPATLALTADALAGECLVVGLVADGFELSLKRSGSVLMSVCSHHHVAA